MADTDILKPYRKSPPYQVKQGDKVYLSNELDRIQITLDQVIEVLKRLEARIEAVEP